jgi:hypothetical protein
MPCIGRSNRFPIHSSALFIGWQTIKAGMKSPCLSAAASTSQVGNYRLKGYIEGGRKRQKEHTIFRALLFDN